MNVIKTIGMQPIMIDIILKIKEHGFRLIVCQKEKL